jgi:hypothetical protein
MKLSFRILNWRVVRFVPSRAATPEAGMSRRQAGVAGRHPRITVADQYSHLRLYI